MIRAVNCGLHENNVIKEQYSFIHYIYLNARIQAMCTYTLSCKDNNTHKVVGMKQVNLLLKYCYILNYGLR